MLTNYISDEELEKATRGAGSLKKQATQQCVIVFSIEKADIICKWHIV